MELIETTYFAWFRKLINSLSSWLEWVGMVAMVGIVLDSLIDVVGTKLFQSPLPGSDEIATLLQIVALAGGLAFSQVVRRHIRVDLLLDKLSKRGKAGLELFNSTLGLALFIIVGWGSYKYGLSLFSSSTTTLQLKIPYYLFAIWIAFCCIPMCCVIVMQSWNSIKGAMK